MLVFYHAPGSSSMAVHIALHEVGVAYEGRTIAFDRRDQDPPEFRGLNPEGKVPTLVVEGRVLTEVAACLYYLAKRYPEAKLFPSGDIEAEAQVVSWMSFIAATLHPARRQGQEHARAVYRLADQRLEHQRMGNQRMGDRLWAAGGAYSIADIHLFRLFWRFRGSLGADPATFPNLTAHHDRMMQRPAVRKTVEIEAALGYTLPA
jgi:glutathione S-transferase